MGQKFKDLYDGVYVGMLGGKIAAVAPGFDAGRFAARLAGDELERREFLARMDLIVEALDYCLTDDYPANLAALRRMLGAELATEHGMFTVGWWLWPLAHYVTRHATRDFAASVAFIEELTKRHTGEFAVRPLLAAFPDDMLAVMAGWSRSANVHLRRLASEGLRIHLPWAKKLPLALERFEAFKAILTNLKDDPSRFVQKSVGNNLNDLFRDAPDKARQIIAEWEEAARANGQELSPAARWIIRHGTRRQS
jgi:3-methyladenine DNA glycosylase AlkC